jgi:N-acetylmuramoyl-L-alanine amidase
MALCTLTLFTTQVTAAGKHKFTLVIDAGHGGKDAGACANKAMEKNINLSVALAFGKLVEQNCPDVKVIYTRKTDVFIPLHQRANIANKNKADLFISVHTNAVEKGTNVTGMVTYTMGMRRSGEKLSAAMRENKVIIYESDYKQRYAGFDPNQPESYIIFDYINEVNMAKSVEMAQLIQKHVCATAKRPNKGVKQDAFLVLRETSMPACLIELGYITTPAEAAFLTNKTNVNLMAKGMYQAFVAYKNKQTGTAKPLNPEKNNSQPEEGTKTKETKETKEAKNGATTFRVQILASTTQLPTNDRQMKGLKNVKCLKEGSRWKYTVGDSEDYSEIVKLRKEILPKFPDAYIIAVKDGATCNVNKAIQEYKNNKNKR